jgi:hypothetical protein
MRFGFRQDWDAGISWGVIALANGNPAAINAGSECGKGSKESFQDGLGTYPLRIACSLDSGKETVSRPNTST